MANDQQILPPIMSPITPPPITTMPRAIVMALIKAVKETPEAKKSGKGTDAEGKEFKFSTIDDVLEVANKSLGDNGLHVLPIEVGCTEEVRKVMTPMGYPMDELWATYEFQFLIVHEQGETWINERDKRRISLRVKGGQTEGQAQSFATKHFYRGLLRIRTGEMDIESEPQVAAVPIVEDGVEDDAPLAESVAAAPARTTSTPTPTSRPGRGGARRSAAASIARLPFLFGADGVPVVMTIDDALAEFDAKVCGLRSDKRQQWGEANADTLRQIKACDEAAWLHLRRGLDGLNVSRETRKSEGQGQ